MSQLSLFGNEELEKSCSCQAGFPVSHSPMPDSVEARQMTATSGRKCSELLRNLDPVGCLVKMLLESSIWRSTRCYLTWKAKATPQGRLYFQLAVSVPHIEGIGYSLLPTPQVAFQAPNKNANIKQWGEDKTLWHMAKNDSWPDKLWPTPNAGDYKAGFSNAPNRQQSSLPRTVGIIEGIKSGGCGTLNPEWVGWLMGFSPRWLDVD